MKLSRLAFVPLSVLLLGADADVEKAIEQVPGVARCTALEREGGLIAQRFKRSKVCTESKEIKGWTDCRMKAGGTEVWIHGALGADVGSRTTGLLGSGFRLLALDPGMTARPMFNEKLGLMLRIDAKNATTPEGCVYDEAHITLDAQVLTSGDMNRIEYPALSTKMNPRERIQALQRALTLLGYDPGPEDGSEGVRLRSSIAAYRRDRHVALDLPDENVRQAILLDAAMKSLDEMKDAYDQLAPEP